MNAPSKSVSETCKLAIPLEYVPFLSEKDGRGIARIGNFRFKEIAPFNNYNLVQFSLSVLTRPSLFYRENYPKFTLFPRYSYISHKVTLFNKEITRLGIRRPLGPGSIRLGPWVSD